MKLHRWFSPARPAARVASIAPASVQPALEPRFAECTLKLTLCERTIHPMIVSPRAWRRICEGDGRASSATEKSLGSMVVVRRRAVCCCDIVRVAFVRRCACRRGSRAVRRQGSLSSRTDDLAAQPPATPRGKDAAPSDCEGSEKIQAPKLGARFRREQTPGCAKDSPLRAARAESARSASARRCPGTR